jgi:ribosomal protein S18 acetylase RimI-like enzyme
VEVVDLVPLVDRPGVRELVSLSVGYPTPEKLGRVLRRYADDPARHLVGFERAGSLDGYVGYEIHAPASATIWNIAVRPGARGQGLGRAIVRWLIDTAGLTHLSQGNHLPEIGTNWTHTR